jgi:hypothetical protein
MFRVEIKGLETVSREMNDLAMATARLDGEIVKLNFDPRNPAAVRQAIHEMDRAVDSRVGNLIRSASVRKLVQEMKSRYRTKIEDIVRKSR